MCLCIYMCLSFPVFSLSCTGLFSSLFLVFIFSLSCSVAAAHWISIQKQGKSRLRLFNDRTNTHRGGGADVDEGTAGGKEGRWKRVKEAGKVEATKNGKVRRERRTEDMEW